MRTVALLFAAAFVASAQPAPTAVRHVVDVKHLTGDRAERAVRLVNQFMHPAGSMNVDPVLRVGVMVGPEDVVRGAETLFAKLDSPTGVKPDLQIQFRFYLVEGTPEAAPAGALPPEITSAVDQLRKALCTAGIICWTQSRCRPAGQARPPRPKSCRRRRSERKFGPVTRSATGPRMCWKMRRRS